MESSITYLKTETPYKRLSWNPCIEGLQYKLKLLVSNPEGHKITRQVIALQLNEAHGVHCF